MQPQEHWEKVYTTKAIDTVSWYQERSELSLRFIRQSIVSPDAAIIDVGGGASVLVDNLLEEGYKALTVLDISGAALAAAQQRLGADASKVTWLEADITKATLPAQTYDVWHDRAVFHFLTDGEQRKQYHALLKHALKPNGHVVIATFAENGPEKCSGLTICRYSSSALAAEFGAEFQLLNCSEEVHKTPSGGEQNFIYCHFQRVETACVDGTVR